MVHSYKHIVMFFGKLSSNVSPIGDSPLYKMSDDPVISNPEKYARFWSILTDADKGYVPAFI